VRDDHEAGLADDHPLRALQILALDVVGVEDVVGQGGQVVDQVTAGTTGDERRAGLGRHGRHRPEHGVELAREVVEQGAARDLGALGEVVEGEAVEAALLGELLCAPADLPLGAQALPLASGCTFDHGVHSCTIDQGVQNCDGGNAGTR
jgi:hypothetical protein